MMNRTLFALSLGLVGMIHAAQMARANAPPQCADRGQVVDILAQKYGETRRSIGLAANNTVMELYASTETGSWTLAVTLPDGVTCLMASGQGFQAVTEDLPARGDPA